jgi:hypothetical protein
MVPRNTKEETEIEFNNLNIRYISKNDKVE